MLHPSFHDDEEYRQPTISAGLSDAIPLLEEIYSGYHAQPPRVARVTPETEAKIEILEQDDLVVVTADGRIFLSRPGVLLAQSLAEERAARGARPAGR